MVPSTHPIPPRFNSAFLCQFHASFRLAFICRLSPRSRTACHGIFASSHGFDPSKSKTYDGIPRLGGKGLSLENLKGSSGNHQSKYISTDKVVASRLVVASNSRQRRNDTEVTDFEKRLDEIRSAAEEKKRLEKEKMNGPIDYDYPASKPDAENVSFPVKVGIGLGVVLFGLIFAFGDLIPNGGLNVQRENLTSPLKKNSEESVKLLKEQLRGFEAILKIHPDDLDALEGAAVTNAELGKFSESEVLLRHLVEKRPVDVEALRLLGEVQSSLEKFEGSEATYRRALKISPGSITLWKGFIQSLVSQGKQSEAIKELNFERDRVTSREDGSTDKDDKLTLIQIELLIGRTYAEWGHISDAISVYDSLIETYPDDFQGYLAKGILLKDQGQKGEASRMFIQARYFAPDKMKALVDRYSKQL